MSDTFDPYYTWLGIPPEDQPASHYRLLGLKDFEANLDVITNAADQRMGHLRTLQTGKKGAISQQILNEVSAAASTLLVPEKKAAYDLMLRQSHEFKRVIQASRAQELTAAHAVPVAHAPPSMPSVAPLPPFGTLPAPGTSYAPPVIPQPLASQALAPQPFVSPVPQPAFGSLQGESRLRESKHGDAQPARSSSMVIVLAAIVVGALFTAGVVVVASMNSGPEVAKGPENSATSNPENENSTPTPPAVNPPAPNDPPQPATNSPDAANQAATANPQSPPVATDTKSANPFEEVTNPFEETTNPAAPSAANPALNPGLNPGPAMPASPASAVASNDPTAPASLTPTQPGNPSGSENKLAPTEENPFAESLAKEDPSAPVFVRGIQVFDLPTEEQLAAARTQVLEIFGKEAKQAIKPELKVALARKMEKLGRETKDDPAGRYVLLDNVRKLFAGAGEVTAALTAAQNLQDWYRFDDKAGPELQLATFNSLADATLSAEQRERLVDRLLIETDAAVQEHDISLADQYSLLAMKASSRLKEVDKKKTASQQRTSVVRLKNEYAEFDRAQETLKTTPEDAVANLIAGKFLAGIKQDWKTARTHLALAGIAEVKTLLPTDQVADDDRSVEDAGDLQLAAADAWFEWSHNPRGADSELVKLGKVRAKYWYRQAQNEVSGLNRAKVDKRLKELADVDDTAAPRPAGGASAANDTKAVTQNYEPGMRGVLIVDNDVKTVMFTYHPGVTVSSHETFTAIMPYRQGATSKVRLLFDGVLLIPRDGEYTITHAGGSASRGVHTLYLRGTPLMVVGDDRTKNDSRTIRLAKGEHPIRWELTGGELGSALIDVQPAAGAAADIAAPQIVTSKQVIATLKQRMRSEASFGANPVAVGNGNLPARNGSAPPPSFGPRPSFGPPGPGGAAGTSASGRPDPKTPVPPIAPLSSAANVNSKPGLFGRVYLDGSIKPTLASYQNDNKIIEANEFDAFLSPVRTKGQTARIAFEGLLHIVVDGEYTFVHTCDGKSGNRNYVTLNHHRISDAGDGSSAKEEFSLTLQKGFHLLRWEMNGVDLGAARLHVRPPQDAPASFPQPEVFTPLTMYDSAKKNTLAELRLGQKLARD
jgi:hypothetical protein